MSEVQTTWIPAPPGGFGVANTSNDDSSSPPGLDAREQQQQQQQLRMAWANHAAGCCEQDFGVSHAIFFLVVFTLGLIISPLVRVCMCTRVTSYGVCVSV